LESKTFIYDSVSLLARVVLTCPSVLRWQMADSQDRSDKRSSLLSYRIRTEDARRVVERYGKVGGWCKAAGVERLQPSPCPCPWP
jgi:hypothetical protein